MSGQQILDPEGNPAVLKGISFGNTNYGNPSDISLGPVNDHDAGSYFELAAMGLAINTLTQEQRDYLAGWEA